MRYLPLTGGAVYLPVSLAEFTAAVHIDEAEDTGTITLLISAAVEAVERAARRSIGLRDIEFIAPGGCWGRWYFPVAPIVSVLLVEAEDADGAWQPVDSLVYRLRRGHDTPHLQWLTAQRDRAGFRVQARAGLDGGPEALPLRQAVILLAKEWHDAGIVATDVAAPDLSIGVRRLIQQARYMRPAEVEP